MTTLIFEDRGWVVCTSSWSVGGKPGKNQQVKIVYTWGADGISIFNSATGDASCFLPYTIEQFTDILLRNRGGIIDLRTRVP